MSGNYFNNYNKNNFNNKKQRRTLTPLEEFKNHTELTKKSVFIDYILTAINNGIKPEQVIVSTQDGKEVYYVLCPLPLSCFAVYMAGMVYVAEGRYGDGSLKFMRGVEYDEQRHVRLFAEKYNMGIWEEDFVRQVRQLVETYFPFEYKPQS